MIRGIYLRCNGQMACYCGPGEEVILGQLPLDGMNYHFVDDFYHNKQHANVRQSMSENVLPYPGVCLKCIYLEPYLDPQVDAVEREIEWMHVEATSQCNLDCLFCIPQDERRTFRKMPFFLPTNLFQKIIQNIAQRGMTVKWMYFSGRGEPCLHKDIWSMVKMAKADLGTNFMVNTNGNISYSDLILESGLDKIKIAVDGAFQRTYEKYRQGGRLSKILDLTKKIFERKRQLGIATPKVIWQYILFDHNDNLNELEKIQTMAIDLGVDEVLFKATFTHNYSSLSLEDIPRIHPCLNLLDIKGMIYTPESELTAKLRKLEFLKCEEDWHHSIPVGIDIAKRIFQKALLGIEKKQMYNAYGQAEDVSFFYELGCRYKNFAPWFEALRYCFKILASAYEAQGRANAAQYYKTFES